MMWLHLTSWLGRPLLAGRTRGAAFTEYAVLIALVAVAVIGAITAFGDALQNLFNDLATRLGDMG